jgi:hypothetical protein
MPALKARMAATMKHELPPDRAFPVQHVLWWTLRAAFGGSPRVVPQFVAIARRGAADSRELRLRQRLLAEAEAADAQSQRRRDA